MASFADFQQKAHNSEVATYDHLSKLPKGKTVVPKIYVAKMFSDCNPLKGYIIMEYIQNIEIDILASFSLREVKQVLRFKAIVEASSIDVPPEHRKDFFDAPFGKMAELFLPEEEVNKAIETLRTVEGGRLANEAQRLQGIVPELLDFEWVDNLADELGMDRVLCHGDLYPMNTLWKQGDNGLELAAVIDYQVSE
ncbi:CHK domain-containing protein [Trichostrongylus colubriformis]|uniref:CHK domain-containing protein n=1 Tax=Trichostrongylus colubriformis TaxID=6319 RepID=A0AAN8FSX7_TRICO